MLHSRINAGPRGGRNRAAPDISSEVYFPTLGGSSSDADVGRRKGAREADFEEVRSSGSNQHNQQSKNVERPRLTLGNKFDALGND